MIRILIALGSVVLEVLTAVTEGAMAVSLVLAGIIITGLHMTVDSASFERVLNWLTGFDLPETLESFSSSPSVPSSMATVEEPVQRPPL